MPDERTPRDGFPYSFSPQARSNEHVGFEKYFRGLSVDSSLGVCTLVVCCRQKQLCNSSWGVCFRRYCTGMIRHFWSDPANEVEHEKQAPAAAAAAAVTHFRHVKLTW